MPLLFEGGLDRYAAMTITVSADPETQLRRLMARDASQRDAAEARIAAQARRTPAFVSVKYCVSVNWQWGGQND